ncbi:MAG: hypothetical protein AB7P20_03090 [Rhizobiaceae bacterium]
MAQVPVVQSLFDDLARREAIEFAVRQNSPARMPTAEAYGQLQQIGAVFNERHFGGMLPNVMFTFTRQAHVAGYFCADAFRDRGGAVAHEIALNLSCCDPDDDRAAFRTIAHEFTHLWRHLFGRRNRKGGFGAPGYHDFVWAEKMIEIGLMPSSTGRPGGKRTGFRMSDYLIECGPLDLTCRELAISGFKLNWGDGLTGFSAAPAPDETDGEEDDRRKSGARRRPSRRRFECAGCEMLAWARPAAALGCLTCNLPLTQS